MINDKKEKKKKRKEFRTKRDDERFKGMPIDGSVLETWKNGR